MFLVKNTFFSFENRFVVFANTIFLSSEGSGGVTARPPKQSMACRAQKLLLRAIYEGILVRIPLRLMDFGGTALGPRDPRGVVFLVRTDGLRVLNKPFF